MKKNLFSILAFAIFLTACAGNPPAWWNPSNAYSSDGSSISSSSKGSSSSGTEETQPQFSEETPIPQEIDMAPLPDESYEEMILTPLQDEEVENDSGVSSSQSAPTEMQPLPPPSVLE